MPVTSCTEFERRLEEAVESRTPADFALFRAHAVECDACARLWDEYLLLGRAVEEWQAESLDVELSDAVLARLAFNEPEPAEATIRNAPQTVSVASSSLVPQAQLRSVATHRASRHGKSVPAVLAAAAVLLVIVAGSFQSQPDRRSPEQPVVADVDRPQPAADEAAVEDLVRNAEVAYRELARDAANVFTDSVVLIPEQPLPPGTTDNGTPGEVEVPGETAPWSRGLEPIGRDVKHAINFLFETISRDSEPAT